MRQFNGIMIYSIFYLKIAKMEILLMRDSSQWTTLHVSACIVNFFPEYLLNKTCGINGPENKDNASSKERLSLFHIQNNEYNVSMHNES